MSDAKAEAKAGIQRAISYLRQAKEVLIYAAELEDQHAKTAHELLNLSQQAQDLIGQCHTIKTGI
jgi:hypothetical protein